MLMLMHMHMLFMMIVVVRSLSIIKLLIFAISLIVILLKHHMVYITASFWKSTSGESRRCWECSVLRWEAGEHLIIMLAVIIIASYRVICVSVTERGVMVLIAH